ncbi:hypothetical protein, partial [Candidatus Entotheonella palauensis]|uniref:hypothetical protein n=1 Tax=Candidatus Entotheonella palauensis TaxID=93172 RepID=UPI001C4DF1CD
MLSVAHDRQDATLLDLTLIFLIFRWRSRAGAEALSPCQFLADQLSFHPAAQANALELVILLHRTDEIGHLNQIVYDLIREILGPRIQSC